MGKAIGIDLGTTYSVAAVSETGGARILHNREARPQTRSVVGLRRKHNKEEVLVGDVALANWPLAPKDTVISVKRLMGRGIEDVEVARVQQWCLYDIVPPTEGTRDSVRVVIGGRQYSPTEISALILGKIKEDCEFRLSAPVTHAVITVPAYFSESQRDATRRAGLLAGLNVTKILDEPTAAAISFGVDRMENAPRLVLVFDLGGGTFDVCLLVWSENSFVPLMLQGDMWLGGDDFDQGIVDVALKHLRSCYSIDPRTNYRFMAELRAAAQAAKETLTSSHTADLILPGLLRDDRGAVIDLDLEIHRDQFEQLIAPFIGRAIDLTAKVLREAMYSPEQVDYVLLVGGSSITPAVRRAVEHLFGQEKVLQTVHPKQCVALGAAILASRLGTPIEGLSFGGGERSDDISGAPKLMVSAVAPFNYGVQLARDEFGIFIAKGEPFPTEFPQAMTFYTGTPNARMISIPVYGGEAKSCASQNEKQGEAFAILPPRLPKGTAVRIRLWLDDDGVFRVAAHLETGSDLRPWIVKGEHDAKAIEAVQNVEMLLAVKGDAVSPEELGSLETIREEIFDEMRRGDFDAALQRASNLVNIAEQVGSDAVWTRGENLIGIAEYILDKYRWLLNTDQESRLESGGRELKAARRDIGPSGIALLHEAILQLERELSAVPELILRFMGIRNAIYARIHAQEPTLALCLVEDLEEVEEEYRRKDTTTGDSSLLRLEEKVGRAFQEIESRQTGSLKCSRGHTVPPGSRICPVCGEDTWLLAKEAMAVKMRR